MNKKELEEHRRLLLELCKDYKQRIDKAIEILYDDNLCHIEKLQEIHKILGDKEDETN